MTILSYTFMQHAFIAGTLAAILAGAIGYFVILRELSFAGHALGHLGFTGASGALLIGLSPLMGQLLITILAALSMGLLGPRLYKSDMAIGIILAFALSLGSLFLHFYQGYAGLATNILFGNLLGVSVSSLYTMLLLVILSLTTLSVIARPLLFASLEPELALAKGIPLNLLALLFLSLMAITVTLAAQIVGILLIFTLLVGPAAISLKWTRTFWPGILFGIVIAVISVWLGIILAFYTNWPISFWISAIILGLYCFSHIRCIQVV